MQELSLSADLLALQALARQINDREEILDSYRSKIEETLRPAAAEIILQGQALIDAKARLKHGEWLPWLKAHCPKISAHTAARYMKRATKETLSYYCHVLCDTEEEHTATTGSSQWLPHIESFGKLNRFLSSLSKCPIDAWPEPAIDSACEQLAPLYSELRKLRPDKFK